jgi:hypothetical protein
MHVTPASAFASTLLPVFQWKVGPEQSPEAVKTKLSIGSWNFVVCWLVYPSQDLNLRVSASPQAKHWMSHGGKTRLDSAGRTEAVSLVYDRKRSGIFAITAL